MKKIIFIIGGLLFVMNSYSQISIYVMPTYELPISFADDPSYKPTMGIKAGFLKEFSNFSLGLQVGYHSFNPQEKKVIKKDQFSFVIDGEPAIANRYCDCEYTEEFGKINYIPILFQFNKDIIKGEKYSFYAGLNFGVMIFNYSHKVTLSDSVIPYVDPFANPFGFQNQTIPDPIVGTITTKKTDGGANLTLKAGGSWKIQKHLKVFFEIGLNLHIEEYSAPIDGQFKPNGYQTTLIYSLTNGLGLAYVFGDRTERTDNRERTFRTD